MHLNGSLDQLQIVSFTNDESCDECSTEPERCVSGGGNTPDAEIRNKSFPIRADSDVAPTSITSTFIAPPVAIR